MQEQLKLAIAYLKTRGVEVRKHSMIHTMEAVPVLEMEMILDMVVKGTFKKWMQAVEAKKSKGDAHQRP
jgi:hypothetical protein